MPINEYCGSHVQSLTKMPQPYSHVVCVFRMMSLPIFPLKVIIILLSCIVSISLAAIPQSQVRFSQRNHVGQVKSVNVEIFKSVVSMTLDF